VVNFEIARAPNVVQGLMTKLSGPARRELIPVSCSNATHGPNEGRRLQLRTDLIAQDEL